METFVTLTTRWRVSTFANSHSKQGESCTHSLWTTGYIATFKTILITGSYTHLRLRTLFIDAQIQIITSFSIVMLKQHLVQCLFINGVFFILNLVNDEQVIDNCNNLCDMTSICN